MFSMKMIWQPLWHCGDCLPATRLHSCNATDDGEAQLLSVHMPNNWSEINSTALKTCSVRCAHSPIVAPFFFSSVHFRWSFIDILLTVYAIVSGWCVSLILHPPRRLGHLPMSDQVARTAAYSISIVHRDGSNYQSQQQISRFGVRGRSGRLFPPNFCRIIALDRPTESSNALQLYGR